MKLIGFCGKAESGKNTAADVVVDMVSGEYKVGDLAFGDNVKKAAAELFDIDIKKFYFNKHDMSTFWGMTHRAMLQQIATDVARQFNKDFWVKRLAKDYAKVIKIRNPDVVLITDVRFINEAEWIRKKGGIIIEITRQVDSALSYCEQEHVSEAGIPQELINKTVTNNGSRKELRNRLEVCLNKFLF